MSQLPDMPRSGPSVRKEMRPPQREFPSLAVPVIYEHHAYIPQEPRNPPMYHSEVQTPHVLSSETSADMNQTFPYYPPPLAADKYCQQNQPLPSSQTFHSYHDPPHVYEGISLSSSSFLRPPPDFSKPPPHFSEPQLPISDSIRHISMSFECQAVPPSQQSCSKFTNMNTGSSWQGGSHIQAIPISLLQTSRDSVCGNLVPLGQAETQEEEDEKWLKEFQQRIKNRQPSQPRKLAPMERTVKLMDLEKMVLESQTLTNNLCQLEKEMKLVRSSAEEDVWQDMVHQVEQIKVKLNEIITCFQDETFTRVVKRLITQRRLKRRRLKKRAKNIQLEKEDYKKARQEEEEKIDAWREKLKMEGEEKRREKAIKAEADGILGEVRQKQNEALRMQQLLESLITLRLTRTNKGHSSTPQNDQHFASTIKNVSEVVKNQMKEYELEEQTLHVMMEESASHQCSIAGREMSAFTRREAVIKKILFGDYSPLDLPTKDAFTSVDHSLDMLIKRRCEWDQFITDDETPLASSLPLHWVIPPDHPIPAWAQFQNR